MFKFNTLRRRVSFSNSHGLRKVRIERQNTPGLYLWLLILGTVICALVTQGMWDAVQRHRDDALYIVPILMLIVLAYLVGVAICLWGALGVEEIEAETYEFCWTRILLKWHRTKRIRYREITAIRAVTPWHGMDNTVEIAEGQRQQRIGAKLLRDEAIELAQFLHKAAGLHG